MWDEDAFMAKKVFFRFTQRSDFMNTVQNGKGDRARNNWSRNWRVGYDAIDWNREPFLQESPAPRRNENMEFNCEMAPVASLRKANDPISRTDLALNLSGPDLPLIVG